MASRRTQSRLIRVRTGDELQRRPDHLIVEEPLEVRLDGRVVATTMRTPGHDFELAAGLCFGDGLLAGHAIRECRYCSDCGSGADTGFNIVSVDTGGRAPVAEGRVGTTTSSCGYCGTTAIGDLTDRLEPVPGPDFPLDVLAAIPDAIGEHQPLFAQTGAVHAAALVAADGTPVVVREDIGRHNAVDKVIGRRVLDGFAADGARPGAGHALYVSGRASFEILQKAWAAGVSAVVAVSAPSSLAVSTAEAAGILLVGFVRGDRINVYTEGDRAKAVAAAERADRGSA